MVLCILAIKLYHNFMVQYILTLEVYHNLLDFCVAHEDDNRLPNHVGTD